VRFGLFLGAAALALTTPAAAAWHQATSKHFIIYSDDTAENVKAYAEKLEKFDAAARVVRSQNDPEVGDGNRVQVFVVPTMLDVNRTLGSADAGVGGYYQGLVTGPQIITPKKARQILDYRKLEPETVFFHEYTHHLQLQSTNKAMPAWLTEGFAEFLANPIFNDDGSVGLGTPATHRAQAIYKSRWAPLGDLLEGKADTLAYAGFWGQNYAQGWLLNHYLAFEPKRKGQIETYVKGIEAGQNARDAAEAAFGDIGQLEGELKEYRQRKAWPYLKIDATKLQVDPVTVAAMSPGASEVMMLRIYAKTGYGALSNSIVLGKVREIAKRHPNDLLVHRTLAEVELDAENFDEAEKAADVALKIDPRSTEAIIYKGRALLARAKKANDANLAKEARQHFAAVNKIDPEDPEALYLYYRSYRALNAAAPKSALEALKYATILAPQDNLVGIQLVSELIRQNDLNSAAEALRPLAYEPHAGQNKRNVALQILNMIEAGQGPQALARIDKEMKDVYEKDNN
jgi:hypothetical protein